MILIWTGGMTDEMKKRIGEVLFVAPWTELNLRSDTTDECIEYNKIKRMKWNDNWYEQTTILENQEQEW